MKKVSSIQGVALLLSLVVITLYTPRIVAADRAWTRYDLSEHGISASFPIAPEFVSRPNPDGDGRVASYRALDEATLRQFTIFIGQPAQRGVFEPESKEAYLVGHLKGLMAISENAGNLTSKRSTFLGMPAMEYTFHHNVEGVPFIASGITFMIDGGHIRLSMWYPRTDTEGPEIYAKFQRAFKLLPVAYRPSPATITDPRGVRFTPPSGWTKGDPNPPYVIAKYNNLTRSMALLVAGNRAYNCDAYKSELQHLGSVLEQSTVTLRGRTVQKVITFSDAPKYNARLTTAHFCLNSGVGAVVLTGTEEQAMYWRWASVIEGAASSLVVPTH